jgi:hypothetical protein
MSLFALALVLLPGSALLAAEGDDLSRGDALVKAWKLAEAFAAYESAARAGNPLALYRIGQMRLRGEGVAQDERRGEADIRRAAEAGVPQAQYAMAGLVWSMGVAEGLSYGERRKKDPVAPDEPFALEALAWEKRAAVSWIRERDPYQAFQIYCHLASDSPFNRFSHLRATPAALDEILAPLQAYPVDRPARLRELQAARPDDPRSLELLRLLMLPVRKPAVLPLDLDDVGIHAILVTPLPGGGAVTAVCARRNGRYGLCGTGRSFGGVTPPGLTDARPSDHVVCLDSDGVPFFQYRTGRDHGCLYDADGDGRAAELLVYDGGYDYARAPHLTIYDLSRAGAPLMAALTFNFHERLEEFVVESEDMLEPAKGTLDDPDGAGDLRPRTFTTRRLRKPILEGAWRFETRADGRRDLVLEWSEGGAARKQLIPFNAATRRWEPPADSDTQFWHDGLLGGLRPVLRFARD